MLKLNSFLFILMLLATSCANNINNNEQNEVAAIPAPNNLSYEVVKVYPHDTSSYTQGLEWNGNSLIESTGNYSESKLILLDTNMKYIKNPVILDKQYFGEGATLLNNKIYQLTWKEHKVLVYDPKTLKKMDEIYWPYEGWGITNNDSSLIINTGGSNLYFVNPADFKVTKTLGVFNNYGYVSNINELEYVNGVIYANVYLTDNIIQIDPNSGQVIGMADMSNLLAKVGVASDPKTIDPGNVLNGIAYHKKRGTFFVTGKDWPVMIELKFK